MSASDPARTVTKVGNDVSKKTAPPGKAAARVARRIEEDIAALGWPTGTTIGSEADLLERYDVSRSVLRQAIRLLEQRSVAENRRGVGGGLWIIEPSAGPVASAASTYLNYRGTSADDLNAISVALDAMSARLAAERIDDAGRAQLHRILEHEAAALRRRSPRHPAETVEENMHIALARVAGNSALELFKEIIFQLSKSYAGKRRKMPTSRVVEDHRDIIEAVLRGDGDEAAALAMRHGEMLHSLY